MTEITLNDTEQRLARYIAETRQQVNSERGVKERKQDPKKDPFDIGLDGYGAELAFCKLFNFYPSMEVDIRSEEDCYTNTGLSVDVKSTDVESGRLIATKWKKKVATNLYALMIGKFPTYKFVGLARGEELFRDENIIDVGNGPFYALSQKKLKMEI